MLNVTGTCSINETQPISSKIDIGHVGNFKNYVLMKVCSIKNYSLLITRDGNIWKNTSLPTPRFIMTTSDWIFFLFKFISDAVLDGKTLLEVGCGVGNTIFPLIKEIPSVFINACDFSKRAVTFVQVSSTWGSLKCTQVLPDRFQVSFSNDTVPFFQVEHVRTCVF